MAYQVLARKYRPQQFSDVIGQDHVTRTLQNAIQQKRIAHGYIFSGHRGIGKTTIARILAMALNCRAGEDPRPEPCGKCESCTEVRAGNSMDVIEIDAATNRGIDEIRELRDAARYRPARDRYKVYILDEAHQITDAAFNALLKTLEEPPAHVIFMLATTAPEDIPQTIRSRCQHFSFHAVKFDDIVAQLRSIAQQEKIQADPDALAMLAEAGDGSMRDALSIMDQAIACCGDRVTAEIVRGLVGSVSSDMLEELMGAVGANNSEQALRIVDRVVSEGQNPVHFARQLVKFLRNAVVGKVSGGNPALLQISADERARAMRVAESFSEEDLARFLQILLRTYDELGYRQEQRFHLELGILKMVHAQRLLPLEELLSGSEAGASSASGTGGARRPGATPAMTTPAMPASAGPGAQRPAGELARPSPFTTTEQRPLSGRNTSPFEADRARKTERSDSSGTAPDPELPQRTATMMSDIAAAGMDVNSGASFRAGTAPVPMPSMSASSVLTLATGTAVAVEDAPEADTASNNASNAAPNAAAEGPLERVQQSIFSALELADQRMLTSLLQAGEWTLIGAEVQIKVVTSTAVADMAFGPEPRRIVTAAATAALARPAKVRLVGGLAAASANAAGPRPAANGPAARRRASDDPLVLRMQEKFGAEIRTVIDHRDKR